MQFIALSANILYCSVHFIAALLCQQQLTCAVPSLTCTDSPFLSGCLFLVNYHPQEVFVPESAFTVILAYIIAQPSRLLSLQYAVL